MLSLGGCTANSEPASSYNEGNELPKAIPAIYYSVTKTYPHDTTAFTEGLLVHEGRLYESTGSPRDVKGTRSLFGAVDLETGSIDVKAELDSRQFFGEGIAFLDGKVYQLTYKDKVGFVYDARTFKKTGEFKLPTKEGWGMTTDGVHLVMSDGTHKLTYLDPATLQTVKTLTVTDESGGVQDLNELEFINGALYANVWRTNTIVKIDTASGEVTGRMDLSSLAREAKLKYRDAMELNGIAYDSATAKVYVTGKMWPHIYEIRFSF